MPKIESTVARLALAHTRAVVALCLLLTAALAALAFPPQVNGDVLNLVSEHDTYTVSLKELRSAPGGEGWVILSFPEDASLAPIAARVEALDTVRATFRDLDPALGARLALLQQDPDALSSVAKRLQAAMATPIPMVQQRLLSGVEDTLQAPQPLLAPGSLLVIPTESNLDPRYCLTLVAQLEAAAPEALWMAGAHVTTARSVQGIQEDLTRTSAVSGLLVLTVLILGLRSLRAPLLVLPPVILGNVVALAGVALWAGALNLYSSMGTALLLGLGVDFGVHLSARYGELRAEGVPPEDAVAGAFASAGRPCVTAALTSAAAFLALMLADFQGLAQLGGMLALGVMACLGFTFALLPALLVRFDPVGKAAPPGRADLTLPRWLAPALVILTLAAGAWALPRLEVEPDLSALRREGMGWAELDTLARSRRVQAFPPIVIPVQEDALAAEHARLAQAVADGRLPHIQRVLSRASVLPPQPPAVPELIAVADDPRRALLPPAVQQALAPLEGLDPAPVTFAELPAGLRAILGEPMPRVLLVVTGNLLDLRESRALRAELEAVGAQGAANEFLVHGALLDLLETDLPRIAWAALLAVTLLCAVDLRRPWRVALAVGALVMAVAWAGVALVAFRVRLNIMNVVALPILLGIGVDVIVHLLHRLEAEGAVGPALRGAGRAAAVSTATTLAAFFSLVFAGNRGVRSVGEVVVVGLSAVFLVTAVAVPAGWAALRR
ncbi:MAG: MMPL family transporter [Alphaproteobacteria bacterium]|nr:MMPL family transporter [Alphaproteobacteria bacterium]